MTQSCCGIVLAASGRWRCYPAELLRSQSQCLPAPHKGGWAGPKSGSPPSFLLQARPSQDKGWSSQQVFPSGFYYKEGSRASQPPPPAPPRGPQPVQALTRPAPGGHFRQKRKGDDLGAWGHLCQVRPSLEQSFPVLRWEPRGPPPRASALAAAIHSWRVISFFNI